MSARRFAFIAGSGMDPLSAAMTTRREVAFGDLPGVGACGVEGHTGRVLEGTVDGHECTLVMGRRHVYEGEATAVEHLMAWLAGRGVTDLVMTSAAGGLHARLHTGDFVIAHDVIDFQNRRPTRHHPRIDPQLTADVERAATAARVSWQRGVIVCGTGPAYETPAEVRALQDWGDAATMSAVPELVAARRLGLRAAAIAMITNPCTGVAASRPNHHEVLETGRNLTGGLVDIVRQLVAV